MKVVSINTVSYGSTGKIMMSLGKTARQSGISFYSFSRKWRRKNKYEGHVYFGFFVENVIHTILGKFFGDSLLYSVFGTLQLLSYLRKIKPDLIHLHNLHGHYLNLPLLFYYIRKNNIPVVWTLHDCWSFTGRCPYFDLTKCDRWKTGCHDCPYPKDSYPKSQIDTTKKMWFLKRKMFTGVKNMVIVTPSQWLANLTRQSFMKDCDVKVINNGINLSVFRPTISDFRRRYNLADKKIVLGVAFGWEKRKGLDVFIDLSKRLGSVYQIVLVGTDDKVDSIIPSNFISIHRTQDQKELAEIYTAADVFVNPTREENYPTVNMEALACGTPVVTFSTGGSPEIIDESCGAVVCCDDVDSLEKEIYRICEGNIYPREKCLVRAQSFDENTKYEEYVKLYEKIIL